MTVRELSEKLSKFPGDTTVAIYCWEDGDILADISLQNGKDESLYFRGAQVHDIYGIIPGVKLLFMKGFSGMSGEKSNAEVKTIVDELNEENNK